jgi:hypothetical protein
VWHVERERRVRADVAPQAHRAVRLEEVHVLVRHARVHLPQHRIVVEHEDPAAVRADDEVIALERDVAERRRRQVEHERLPRVAVVERHVHRAFRAEEQQAGALRVFAQDARVAAVGLACSEAVGDERPRLPVVARAIDVRIVVGVRARIGGDVRLGGIRVRRFHRVDLSDSLEA